MARLGWEDDPDTWMSHDDPDTSVMMQVPEVGPFVRCLLPVRLAGGFTVTFGVWLAVHPDDLQRALRGWWEPSYGQLLLDGLLGNALPLWGLLGVPAKARVRDENQTPYVVESPHPDLARVLSEEWPHDELLSALPD